MRHCYWLAIGATLCCFAVASAEDQVYRKGMGSERGIVTDMSKTEVILSVSGAKRPFPANEIQRITFEGEPNDLAQARTTILTSANYKAALEDLKKIDLKRIDTRPEMVKQEVEFYRAFCQAHLALTEGGEKTAAENALRQFCTDHKDSYHFYPAAELAGDVAAAAGRYADAAKYYNAVAGAPWDETRIRTNVGLARMLSAQG